MDSRSPTTPTDSAIAKAMRAETHLLSLKAALDRWLASQPYALATSHPEPSRALRYVVEVKVRVASVDPVPDEVGTILGDLLTNLRAALDHLAWRGVCRNLGREPTRKEGANRIYFPIESDPRKFEAHPTVKYVSADLAELMRECQPFSDNDAPSATHLAVLRELSRVDKHRAIHAVVGAVVDDPGPGIVVEGARFVGAEPGQRILVPGALVTTIKISPESLGPDSQFGVHSLPVEILFGDGEDVTFTVLSEMRSTVNDIVAEATSLLR